MLIESGITSAWIEMSKLEIGCEYIVNSLSQPYLNISTQINQNIISGENDLVRIRIEKKLVNSILISFFDESDDEFSYKRWVRMNGYSIEVLDEIPKTDLRKRKLEKLCNEE